MFSIVNNTLINLTRTMNIANFNQDTIKDKDIIASEQGGTQPVFWGW